jgi:hypothetical protein
MDTSCLERREEAILHGGDALFRSQPLVPEAEILLLRLVVRDDSRFPDPAPPVYGLPLPFHRI